MNGMPNSDAHGHIDIWTLVNCLQQHPLLSDHQCHRQIRACLLVDDYIWSSFTCLRTDPKAADFIQELHLSTICFIPPAEIFDIIRLMRLHPDWTAVRDIVITNMTQPKHLSISTVSTRSSALSSRSLTRLSSASARSYSTNATGHTFADIAEENVKVEETKAHPARSETMRGLPTIASNSKKTSRRAPSTDRFVCPYQHHRTNYVFITVGNFERHIRADHPGTPWLDAYKYQRPDLQVNTLSTPAGSASTDISATMIDSPCSTKAEVDVSYDFPPTGPEMHIPLNQLTNNTTFEFNRNYYRKFGVHPLPDDYSSGPMNSVPGSATDSSWFDHDDDDHMEDNQCLRGI